MVKKTTVKFLTASGVVLSIALLVGTAWATNLAAPASTSTAINGGAATLNGTTLAFGPSAHPWVAQIYAPAGRCLRLAVTSGPDLGMQVAAPGFSQAYRNDDGGISPCPLCPVIKIASTPNNGWYTVSLNFWTGAPLNGNFVLRYAHYPVGNPNCSVPTTPNVTEHNAKSPVGPEMSHPQQEGEPGAQ